MARFGGSKGVSVTTKTGAGKNLVTGCSKTAGAGIARLLSDGGLLELYPDGNSHPASLLLFHI